MICSAVEGKYSQPTHRRREKGGKRKIGEEKKRREEKRRKEEEKKKRGEGKKRRKRRKILKLQIWPNSKGFGVELPKQGKIHYSRPLFEDF
jgi:hypothetical protein